MATELLYLGLSVVLLLVQVFLQAGLTTREVGLSYNVGPRDESRKPQGVLVGRAARALANLLETYPAFVGLALALVVSQKAGGLGATGAAVWFWARVAFVVLYLSGIAYVRTVAWLVSILGLVLMVAALLG